jgi:hypothetical protein
MRKHGFIMLILVALLVIIPVSAFAIGANNELILGTETKIEVQEEVTGISLVCENMTYLVGSCIWVETGLIDDAPNTFYSIFRNTGINMTSDDVGGDPVFSGMLKQSANMNLNMDIIL